nr:DUF4158 domain-containing protein [Sinorhizobium meliloti]
MTADEDSLIRHYSFSLSDRLEIELRRRDHNRLGLLSYVMRYPGPVNLTVPINRPCSNSYSR